jgi:SAM-dependent methyltransferase
VTPAEHRLLERVDGPVLDVGCGPARHALRLAESGVVTLGIDISLPALAVARERGAPVLHRSIFEHVPGHGRWGTALLLDGNIGIGGDPAALLRRAAELLAPSGRALVELEPPGSPLRQEQVRLCHAGRASAWFPWAFVGADHIEGVARDAGLGEVETWTVEGRWFASLGRCSSGSADDLPEPFSSELASEPLSEPAASEVMA